MAENKMTELDKALKIITYVLYVMPLTFIITGLPLALKRIAPNNVYGFRTRETLENPEIWYSVNNLGGTFFVTAGVISIAVLFALQHYWKVSPMIAVIVGFTLPLISLAIAIIFAFTFG